MPVELMLLGGAALVWSLIALLVLPPGSLLALGIALWSANEVVWGLGGRQVGPYAALVCIGVAVVRYRSDHAREVRLKKLAPASYVPLAAGLLGLALAPSSIDPGNAFISGGQVIVLGVVTLLVGATFEGRTVARAAYFGLIPILAVSVIVSAAGFEKALDNARWSGVTLTPNALGLLAVAWAISSFAFSPRVAWPSTAAAAYVIVLTASRGSALALAAGVVAILWVGARGHDRSQAETWLLRVLVLGVVCAAGFLVYDNFLSGIASGSTTSADLLRDTDSYRIAAAVANWELFLQRPVFGYGFAEKSIEGLIGAHVTPIALAVQLGVFGLVLFLVSVVLMLRTRWTSEPVLAGVVAMALVSGMTEQWWFGAGAINAAVFWMTMAAYASEPVSAVESRARWRNRRRSGRRGKRSDAWTTPPTRRSESAAEVSA